MLPTGGCRLSLAAGGNRSRIYAEPINEKRMLDVTGDLLGVPNIYTFMQLGDSET